MVSYRFVPPVFFFVGLSVFVVAGCDTGPKTVSIRGKYILPEEIVMNENDSLAITFNSESKGNNVAGATAKKNGEFECKSIAPGKYKIACRYDLYLGEKKTHAKAIAAFNKKFANPSAQMILEVADTNEPQTFTLDFVKEKVTKP